MAFAAEKADYDVVIVGAGISGINFAYRLQERNPELSFTILENRHEVGGTWSLFNYPGIRSDSDLYTFGFPWRPWGGASAIAKGDLIMDYLKESASLYGIDKKIQFHHRVNNANFDTTSKTWSLSVTANESEHKTIRSRFLLFCTGYYDYHEPLEAVIPGIENFKGTIARPQFWPKDLDYTGKNVVVIGSGATAITIVPVMAETASHVTMLQRSPSYIIPVPDSDGLERFIRALTWWNKSLQHKLIRAKWVLMTFLLTRFAYTFPNTARKMFNKAMRAQVPSHMPMDPNFTPRYNPWSQRMCFCPNGDFYDSLRSGKASVQTDTISTVTQNTIKLTSGHELHPDIIIPATGLKLQFGGGMHVTVNRQPYNVHEKFIWKGAMLEDLPNAAFSFGYVDSSWTGGADATAQLICRMLKQMQKEGAREIVPRRTPEEKRSLKEEALLKLTSTYIAKGSQVLPKAGATGPWKARSYYMKDMLIAWYGNIKEGMEWVY